MSVKIYHNPRCSKSRQALQLLEDHGVSPEVVEYLKTPPTAEELDALLDRLGLDPRGLLRRKEKEYKESGADDPDLTRRQLIELMVRYPKLIERPIVVKDGKAALGRPPEQVLTVL